MNADGEHELSPEQNLLFTQLQKGTVPLIEARRVAIEQLGLTQEANDIAKGASGNGGAFFQKVDDWILEELKRLRILAYGLQLPITASRIHTPIPTAFYYTHKFDVEAATLLGDDDSFIDMRVVSTNSLAPNVREMLEDGLWVIGVWAAEERLETMRLQAEQPASPPISPLQPATVPINVTIAGLAENIVFKTQTVRRNTGLGKKQRDREPINEKAPDDPATDTASLDQADELRPRKKSGPRSLNPEIQTYLEERSRQKLCKQTWGEESIHLYNWARSKFAVDIRARTKVLAKLKRVREVHAAVYYRLNPEFDRLQRFRHESN